MHLFANAMGSNALALKEKQINVEGPCYVRLVGRKSGLIDWLLNVLKIDTTTVFEIYADRVEYSYSSLSGKVVEVIPLSKVSNLVCGQFKPVILLVLAIICVLAAIPTIGISLIFAIIFGIFYKLKKSTAITVIPNSASATGVAFKRSVIENQQLTPEEAQQIVQIVTYLVNNANSR